MKEYFQRVSDKLLIRHLQSKGAVLIEGAKWCGKTTSAKHIAKSVIEMDRPDMTQQYQQMARIKPLNLLDGEIESQREHQEHHADVGPRLDVSLVDDRHQIGHVGRDEKACDDIAQYEGLLEFLEEQGDDACNKQDEGKVLDKVGKILHI